MKEYLPTNFEASSWAKGSLVIHCTRRESGRLTHLPTLDLSTDLCKANMPVRL